MWGQLYSNMSTGWRLGTDVQPSASAIDTLDTTDTLDTIDTIDIIDVIDCRY